MQKEKSMLCIEYEKRKNEATSFYEKNKDIIETYKKLTLQFQSDLEKKIKEYTKKNALRGKDEYGYEKEVELKDYELVKVIYQNDLDRVKILYRGKWTEAEIRELYVEPEELGFTP